MFKLISRNLILAQLCSGIVIFFGILVLMPAKTAMAQSWLEGEWEYRRPVIVTNTTTTQSDYQVLVTLDTLFLIDGDKMKSGSCNDLRFTDSGGTTTINYWLESGCNTTSTRIWVKVPTIPTGTSTIFAYYGSSTALTLSDGSSTFAFFDDFTGTTINAEKWTEVDTASNYITQSNTLIISNGSATWGQVGIYSKNNFNRATSSVLQAKYKSTCAAGASYHDTTLIGWKNTGSTINTNDFVAAHYFYKKVAGNPVLIIYESGLSRGYLGKFVCSTQYWIRQIINNTGKVTFQISTNQKNWSLIYDSDYYDSTTTLKVGLTHYQGGQIDIDDLLVRIYVSPEPTTKVGGEIARPVSSRPPISGNHTITSDCTFGGGAAGYYGMEEGHLTINAGATLTINPDQIFVWTPGFSVFVNGSIVISGNGQGRKGYLWMRDADSDGYPTVLAQYFSTGASTAPGECSADCRRRKYMSTMTEVDLGTSNACVDSINNYLCGYDAGSGNCNATTSGWKTGLPPCEECNGTSIDPVYSTKGTQRTGCTGSCNFCDGQGICASCGWSYVGNSWTYQTAAGSQVYCNNITHDNIAGYRSSSAPGCTDTSVYSSYTSYPTYGVTYYQLTCQCQ